MQHSTLFNHWWFIRMLVIVARCPRQWSHDFMILWHHQVTFMPFTGLQTFKFKFSENSLWSNILNYLQTKVTPRNPHSCIFFNRSWRSESFDKLNFFSFGLASNQKSFNAACNSIFCIFEQPLWISSIFWNGQFSFFQKNFRKSFLLSNIIFVGYVL